MPAYAYDADSPFAEMPVVRVLSDRTQRAKKPHACGTCSKLIPKGQRYRVVVMLEDGLFRHDRIHSTQDRTGCQVWR